MQNKLVLISVLFISMAYAKEIRLFPPTNIYQVNSKKYIDLKSSEDLLDEEIIGYLVSGIHLSLNLDIRLLKPSLTLDKLIHHQQINIRLHYDLWNERFVVESEQLFDKVLYFANDSALKNFIQNLHRVPFVSSTELEKDNKYYFKTRVTIHISESNTLFHLVYNLLSVFQFRSRYLKGDDFIPSF